MMFKPLKKVYLANSYSSKKQDPDEASLERRTRRDLEAFIAGKLKKKYKVAVFAPIAQSSAMADICSFGTGFSEWEREDYTWILVCNEVWVLLSNGWKESTGVQAEIKFAKENGIPVKFLDKNNLELHEEIPIESLKKEYKLCGDLDDYKI